MQNSLSALVPGAHLEIAAGIVNSNYRLHRMAQNHLATSRSSSGMTTVETAPATYDAKGGMIPAQTAGYSNASRGSFWGSLSYDWQDYEGTTTARDFDGETGAITAGFDYRISPRFLLGGMIDGSKSDFDGSGGNTDVDSLRFALYGTYGESLGFYSDMLVGYGKHDIEQSRTVGGILGLAGSREFETDADSLQALLTLGFAMGNEQFKHGPFAGVEYQNLELDGFNDNGGLINVSVDGHEVDSLRGLIGYRMDATVGNFRPYASVAYAHEFEDGSSNSTASIGGVQFQVGGSELESAVLLSAGTGIAFSPSLVMDIGYRGELSIENNGLDSHGGSLGLTYSF